LVDLGLFRIRSFSGGTPAQVLWGTAVNGVFFFTALFLRQVLGFSPVRAGLAFLPLVVLLVVSAPVVPRLTGAFGAHRVVSAGLVLVCAGLAAVSLVGAGSALTRTADDGGAGRGPRLPYRHGLGRGQRGP
jgi:Na+/melibiose symporter-like transporter